MFNFVGYSGVFGAAMASLGDDDGFADYLMDLMVYLLVYWMVYWMVARLF